MLLLLTPPLFAAWETNASAALSNGGFSAGVLNGKIVVLAAPIGKTAPNIAHDIWTFDPDKREWRSLASCPIV